MNSCLFCYVYSIFVWAVGERHCECHHAKWQGLYASNPAISTGYSCLLPYFSPLVGELNYVTWRVWRAGLTRPGRRWPRRSIHRWRTGRKMRRDGSPLLRACCRGCWYLRGSTLTWQMTVTLQGEWCCRPWVPRQQAPSCWRTSQCPYWRAKRACEINRVHSTCHWPCLWTRVMFVLEATFRRK